MIDEVAFHKILLDAGLAFEQPAFRYFQSPDKWRFGWTTERLHNPGTKADGKFQSFVYMPVGKGARTGAPAEWRLRSIATHTTRRAAKARALKMWHSRVQP